MTREGNTGVFTADYCPPGSLGIPLVFRRFLELCLRGGFALRDDSFFCCLRVVEISYQRTLFKNNKLNTVNE